jgi:nascent polypeptide-associated complex subunit alpha
MSAADQKPITPDEDEIPELEAADQGAEAAADPNGQMPQRGAGKTAKRYAKAMAKLGLKPEPNITKVVIKKTAALTFSINNPETYRFPNSNTFVLFGDAQVDDMGSEAQRAAGKAFASAADAPIADVKPAEAAEGEDEEVDLSGVDEKEVEMVMTQANCSKAKAAKALRNNKGDIVNAIMELTM